MMFSNEIRRLLTIGEHRHDFLQIFRRLPTFEEQENSFGSELESENQEIMSLGQWRHLLNQQMPTNFCPTLMVLEVLLAEGEVEACQSFLSESGKQDIAELLAPQLPFLIDFSKALDSKRIDLCIAALEPVQNRIQKTEIMADLHLLEFDWVDTQLPSFEDDLAAVFKRNLEALDALEPARREARFETLEAVLGRVLLPDRQNPPTAVAKKSLLQKLNQMLRVGDPSTQLRNLMDLTYQLQDRLGKRGEVPLLLKDSFKENEHDIFK